MEIGHTCVAAVCYAQVDPKCKTRTEVTLKGRARQAQNRLVRVLYLQVRVACLTHLVVTEFHAKPTGAESSCPTMAMQLLGTGELVAFSQPRG